MTARGSFSAFPTLSQVSNISRPVLGRFVPPVWKFLPRIRLLVVLTLGEYLLDNKLGIVNCHLIISKVPGGLWAWGDHVSAVPRANW